MRVRGRVAICEVFHAAGLTPTGEDRSRGRRHHAPPRRGDPRRQHRRGGRRSQDRAPRPGRVPRARDAARVGRPGRHRVRRRRARPGGRHHRPRRDPLRGRPSDLVAAAATGRGRRPPCSAPSAWPSAPSSPASRRTALFDLSWLESFLLGAVVASTDAAAVFATLRFTHIRRSLARTLEAESGGNDPMAIALTLGLIAWIEQPDDYGIDDLSLLVVQQLGLGLVVGVGLGAVASWLFGAAAALDRRVRTRRVGRRGARSVRGGRRDRGQRLPRCLPRRPRGRQHARPATGDSSSPSTRVWRSSRRWRCSSCSACSSSRASCPRSRLPGLALAFVLMLIVRPRRRLGLDGCAAATSGPATGCCSAGRGCAAPCRSCSRRSCSLPTSRTRTRSSTPPSSSS